MPNADPGGTGASCEVIPENRPWEDDHSVWVVLLDHSSVALKHRDFLVPHPVTSTDLHLQP